jgi:hypothetical protein
VSDLVKGHMSIRERRFKSLYSWKCVHGSLSWRVLTEDAS